jgi:hypothetical protein
MEAENRQGRHTPGPWRVFNQNGFLAIVKGRKEVVSWKGFDSSDFPEDVEANAALIASAPDLLAGFRAERALLGEALAVLREAVQNCPCSLRERESGHRLECFAINARDILAKAEGRAMPREEPQALCIVEAAVEYNGKIYTGKRHAEIMEQIRQEHGTTDLKITQEQQGFMTNRGHFVNRYQAGAIACQAGQTKTRHDSLLSEHLW